MAKVNFKMEENNINKVLNEERKAKERILTAIGMKAVSIWQRIITQKKVVDTGRYLNSASYKIVPSENRVDVGSPINNPPYPIYLEVGTSKMKARPTLKPAIMDYSEVYKKLAEQILKG